MQAPILDKFESEMLDGGHGLAKQEALKLLMRYASIVGASRFIPIVSAHIDGCLYHGKSSLDFAEKFLSLDGQVSVPTTLNVGAVDIVHPELNQGDAGLINQQRKLTDVYTKMGCTPSLTCAPYQRKQRPERGDNIAWAESNAIVFANSVLGARTERYGDFIDLCAALTGRVPLTGLHCEQNRYATIAIVVENMLDTGLSRDIYFGCVGYTLGKIAGSSVAAVIGLPNDTNEDELKCLGAAAAAAGNVAMFHAVGITPEAPTLMAAQSDSSATLPSVAISAEDLCQTEKYLCGVEAGEAISAICLGTPHFSLAEFRQLAGKLGNQRAVVEVYVSTSRETARQVSEMHWYHKLEDFGVQIVVDTCTYLAPVVRQDKGVVLTNSTKWAYYAPGNLKRRAGLVSLDRCIRSAQTGYVCE